MRTASESLGRLTYPLVLLVARTRTPTTLALVIFDNTGEPNVKNELDALLQHHARLRIFVRSLTSVISAKIIDGCCCMNGSAAASYSVSKL